tara:strand:+ start:54 stop:503 length:450 start_codon:yes stop_codon:yes gene_type:complete
MVVKASTKKWLIDRGLDQHTAHLWADGITIFELIRLNFDETMQHLYWNCFNRQYALTNGDKPEDMIDKQTFFRDGPPKDMGFYPFTWAAGKDMRYDDYIYEFIQRVKREYANGEKSPPLGGDAVVIWGERDKPQIAFINYNILPFNEKS